MKKYDAVIFDLDGTLLDTLEDLKNSANAAAARYGLPERSREEIGSFTGNGIHTLISRVVPGGEEHPEFEHVFEAFKEHYAQHCMDETKPYPGIMALLEWMKTSGYRTAIVSNKADFAVKKLKELYFEDLVEIAIGEREGIRRKPDPDCVLQSLAELGVEKEHAVYVGDSEVDLLTAQNAGMDCIAVSWGFRSRDFLLEHGAKPEMIAATVSELKAMIEGAPEG
jgi:phosphoglycolate phosphatase